MNKNAARISLGLFFIIFFIEIVRINMTFQPVVQQINVIGAYLFSRYVIPFELLSLILVGGIIGMLYVAGKEDDEA